MSEQTRCSCDAFTDDPCPVHARENALQEEVLTLRADRDEWRRQHENLLAIYQAEVAERDRVNARRRQLSGAHNAESWNAAHPVGTAVRYWPIYPPHGIAPHVDTTTRSEAWALGDGSVVVLIEGRSGGVYLSHIEVLP